MSRRRSSMRHHRMRDYGRLLTLFALMIGAIVAVDYSLREELTGKFRAVDGDSLVTRASGERIRLHGIDAPELGQTCTRDLIPYDCGRQAHRFATSLVKRGMVVCTILGRDRYDRILARCRVGETDIAEALVRSGWAVSYGRYSHAEDLARAERKGLWEGKFERPVDYRRHNRSDVKGIDLGEMISNLRGRISEWKQEVWQ